MRPFIKPPTIPLKQAQLRVERFREQLTGLMPEANIPRAILIPIDDILAIIERFQVTDEQGNVHNTLKGVRAYFSVKATDQALPDDVTALIVPVDLKGNDIVVDSTAEVGEDDSEIYDFTRPCPTECDKNSPLFV